MISLTYFENLETNTGPRKPSFDADGAGDGFSTVFAGFIPLTPVTPPSGSINGTAGGSVPQQELPAFQAEIHGRQKEFTTKLTGDSEDAFSGLTGAVGAGEKWIVPDGPTAQQVSVSGQPDPAAESLPQGKPAEILPIPDQESFEGAFSSDVVLTVREPATDGEQTADPEILILNPDRQYIPKPALPAKFDDVEVNQWELPANEYEITEPSFVPTEAAPTDKAVAESIPTEKVLIEKVEIEAAEIARTGIKPVAFENAAIPQISQRPNPEIQETRTDHFPQPHEVSIQSSDSEVEGPIAGENASVGSKVFVKAISPGPAILKIPQLDFATDIVSEDGEVSILQDIPPEDWIIDFDTTPILEPFVPSADVPNLALESGLFDAKIQELMKRNVPPLGPDGYIAMTNPEFAKRYSQSQQPGISPIKVEPTAGSDVPADSPVFTVTETSAPPVRQKTFSTFINNISGLIRNGNGSPTEEVSEAGLYEPNVDTPPAELPGDLKPRQNGSPHRANQIPAEPGKPLPEPGVKMPAEKFRFENPRPIPSGQILPGEQAVHSTTALRDPLLSITKAAVTGFDIVNPVPDKRVDREFSGVNFERFLQSVSKEQGPVSIIGENTTENIEIFRQVEKPVLELAALVEKTDGNKTLKIRLNPVELGEVEIHIEHRSDGSIKAHIKTESESAQKMLTSGLEQLRETLQNNGWRVESLEISSSPFASNGNESREDGSRQNENVRRTDHMIAELDEPNDNHETGDDSDRLVNLRA